MRQMSPLDLSLNPLLRVAVSLIVGLMLGFYLASRNIVHLLPIVLITYLAALVLALVYYRRPQVSGVLICLTVVCLGVGLAVYEEQRSRVALPDVPVGYDAIVMSEPVRHGKVVQCDLYLLEDGVGKTRASILCDTISQRFLRLHVGDGIHAVSWLEQPDAPDYRTLSAKAQRTASSTHSFDYGRWLRTHHYRARTFIYSSHWQKAVLPLRALPLTEHLRLKAMTARQKLVEQLQKQTRGSDELAVVLAMTLGDKSLLSASLRDVYSVSAASHVLALSGLHLAIVYGVLMFFLRPFRRRSWTLALVLSTVWCYVWVVGMSPSVVRSATMLTLYGLCSLLERRNLSFNVLSFAAIAMLLVHPYTLFDVGFQLSFLSVSAILLFMPLFLRLLRPLAVGRWRLLRAVYSLLAVSLAAQIGTAPLVAYYFGRFPCYFLLTSVVAIPLVTLILWFTIVFFLTAWWLPLQAQVASLLEGTAHVLNGFLTNVASWPGAAIEGLTPTRWQVVVCYLVILMVYQLWVIVQRRPAITVRQN